MKSQGSEFATPYVLCGTCTNLQADLGLHSPHMPEGMSSHGAAHKLERHDYCKTAIIENINPFLVNTISIIIKCNENINIFTSAKHE